MTKNPLSLQKKLNIERSEEVKRMYKRLIESERSKDNLQKQIDILKADFCNIELDLKEIKKKLEGWGK